MAARESNPRDYPFGLRLECSSAKPYQYGVWPCRAHCYERAHSVPRYATFVHASLRCSRAYNSGDILRSGASLILYDERTAPKYVTATFPSAHLRTLMTRSAFSGRESHDAADAADEKILKVFAGERGSSRVIGLRYGDRRSMQPPFNFLT